MTLTSTYDEPFLTTCDVCNAKMAAMPGPRFRRGRPEPPAGYRVGFLIEPGVDREYPMCSECFRIALAIV